MKHHPVAVVLVYLIEMPVIVLVAAVLILTGLAHWIEDEWIER